MLGSVRASDVHHTSNIYEFGTRYLCVGIFTDGVKWAYHVQKCEDEFIVGGCVGVFMTDDIPSLESLQPAHPNYSNFHEPIPPKTRGLTPLSSSSPTPTHIFHKKTIKETIELAIVHISSGYFKALSLEDEHTFALPYNVMGKQQRASGDVQRALPPQDHECIMHIVKHLTKPPIDIGILDDYSTKTVTRLQHHGDVHFTKYNKLNVIHVYKNGTLRKDTYLKVLKLFLTTKLTTLRLMPLDSPADSYAAYGLALQSLTKKECELLASCHVGVCVYADSALGDFYKSGFHAKCSAFPFTQSILTSIPFPKLIPTLQHYSAQLESTFILPLRTSEEWQPMIDEFLFSNLPMSGRSNKTLRLFDSNKPLKRQLKLYIQTIETMISQMEADQIDTASKPIPMSNPSEFSDNSTDTTATTATTATATAATDTIDTADTATNDTADTATIATANTDTENTDSSRTVIDSDVKKLAEDSFKKQKAQQQIQYNNAANLKELTQYIRRNNIQTMETPDNGDCLYYAIDQMLNGTTTEQSMQALRHQLADWVHDHPNTISVMKAFLPLFLTWEENHGAPMDDYEIHNKDFFQVTTLTSPPTMETYLDIFIESIRKPGVWGDMFIVNLFEEMLNLKCIVVVFEGKQVVRIDVPVHVHMNTETKVVYLANHSQTHFESMHIQQMCTFKCHDVYTSHIQKPIHIFQQNYWYMMMDLLYSHHLQPTSIQFIKSKHPTITNNQIRTHIVNKDRFPFFGTDVPIDDIYKIINV